MTLEELAEIKARCEDMLEWRKRVFSLPSTIRIDKIIQEDVPALIAEIQRLSKLWRAVEETGDDSYGSYCECCGAQETKDKCRACRISDVLEGME